MRCPKKVYGGKRIFTILFDIYVFLPNVVGTSIILNMSGTFLTELTGVSTIVGMILIAIITVILVKYRDKLIRYANSIMTIVLLVGFVVISLLVVYLFGPQVSPALVLVCSGGRVDLERPVELLQVCVCFQCLCADHVLRGTAH